MVDHGALSREEWEAIGTEEASYDPSIEVRKAQYISPKGVEIETYCESYSDYCDRVYKIIENPTNTGGFGGVCEFMSHPDFISQVYYNIDEDGKIGMIYVKPSEILLQYYDVNTEYTAARTEDYMFEVQNLGNLERC